MNDRKRREFWRLVIFIFSCFLLVVGALWYLRSGGFEPFIAMATGILSTIGIIVDLCLKQTDIPTDLELEVAQSKEVKRIAAELGIPPKFDISVLQLRRNIKKTVRKNNRKRKKLSKKLQLPAAESKSDSVELIQEKLDELEEDRLLDAAKTVGEVPTATKTKKQLRDEISDQRNQGIRLGRSWNRTRISILIGTLILIWPVHQLARKIAPIPRETPPEVELRWCQEFQDDKDQAQERYVSLDACEVEFNEIDVLEKTYKVPIKFGVKNLESNPLEVARVKLAYPIGMKVESSADVNAGQVELDDNWHIYEKNLGTLDPSSIGRNRFKKLSVDTVTVPADFSLDRFVVFASDGIPVLMFSNLIWPNNRLRVRYEMYCKGRAPLVGNMNFNLKMSVKLFSDLGIESHVETPSWQPQDDDFFVANEKYLTSDIFENKNVVDWTKSSWEGRKVHYREILLKDNRLQLVGVNDSLVRLTVDYGDDGYSDLILARSADKKSKFKVEFKKPFPFVSWKPVDLTVQRTAKSDEITSFWKRFRE